MQITQELSLHAGNMKSTVKRLKALRPPMWIVSFVVVATFLAGWVGGWVRGFGEGNQSAAQFSAFVQSISAKDRADGGDIKTHRYYLRAIDGQVAHRAALANATWRQTIAQWTSPLWWMERYGSLDKKDHKRAIREAEQRLALTVPISEVTRGRLSAMNRAWIADNVTDGYRALAEQYSALLDRKIDASQLVDDAEIRERLDWEKQYRSSGKP